MEKVCVYDPNVLKNIFMTLVTNSDITSTIPQLTQIIDEFREILPNLQVSKDTMQNADDQNIQNNCSRDFNILLDKIILAINDYAVMSENAELLSFISFIKESPVIPDNSDFTKKIKLILEYAQRYLSAIERFGVKKHHLIELELEINSCEKYNQMNEKDIAEKLRILLKRIDHLIEGLKIKYPRFYNEYQMSKLTQVKSYSFENLSAW